MRIITHDRKYTFSYKGVEYALSPQEMRVWQQFSRGQTASEIARTMNLSIKTISGYLFRIRQGMGVIDTNKLLVIAVTMAVEAKAAESDSRCSE